ncbi:MAG: hypothetical protein GX963_05025 [Bacteroidales bacterium]|nr:hypothetical protein [Bacteroidales bacterium]
MMNMSFREFNNKAEKTIYVAIKEVLMQPRNVLTLGQKIEDMGKVLEVYNNTYKQITGKDININELIGVMKDDR